MKAKKKKNGNGQWGVSYEPKSAYTGKFKCYFL